MCGQRLRCPQCDSPADNVPPGPSETELLVSSESLDAREAALQEATRRLCAENARRKGTEATCSALVGNSLQGFLILQGGRLVFTNHALCDLAGYTDAELCGRATRLVDRRSPRHEITLDFDPPEIVVNVDAPRIGQVVYNLLDNAIKYSPKGGQVQIRGRFLGEHALIAITDRGIGITEEDMRHSFERFYRGHNDTFVTRSGAGLGLPLCRGIVEAHGGRIWVDSRLGEGTTVSFTLPTYEDRPEEIA